jgi:hypothetical protein
MHCEPVIAALGRAAGAWGGVVGYTGCILSKQHSGLPGSWTRVGMRLGGDDITSVHLYYTIAAS